MLYTLVKVLSLPLETHGQIVAPVPLEGVAPLRRHILRVVSQLSVLVVRGHAKFQARGLVALRGAGEGEVLLLGRAGEVTRLVELVGLVEVDRLVEVE